MSAVEAAIEKVRHLPEDKARKVLDLIVQLEATPNGGGGSNSVVALGFARRYRKEPRATGDWMRELREGDR